MHNAGRILRFIEVRNLADRRMLCRPANAVADNDRIRRKPLSAICNGKTYQTLNRYTIAKITSTQQTMRILFVCLARSSAFCWAARLTFFRFDLLPPMISTPQGVLESWCLPQIAQKAIWLSPILQSAQDVYNSNRWHYCKNKFLSQTSRDVLHNMHLGELPFLQ